MSQKQSKETENCDQNKTVNKSPSQMELQFENAN